MSTLIERLRNVSLLDDYARLEAADEIERLGSAIEAIKQATIAGRVCDDVAWFDTITTLHDYCDQTLHPAEGD